MARLMKMNLFKGCENALVIDKVDEAQEQNTFLAKCYLQAGEALNSYLKQADRIRKDLKNCSYSVSGMNNILYRSPHNIIAFTGRRGTGKTSTMLSFSEALNSEKGCKSLKLNITRGFVVLNPIDPTMLEEKQNILNAVLSRLIFKAQESWEDQYRQQRSYYNLEEQKNQILSKAQDCMNEIQAIKSSREIDSLQRLQSYGDSAVLKKDLFELVRLLNEFCLTGEKSENSILIIPVDDTDCQIAKAYDVMEDIRRYLTLPNVVILMATDIDMLRRVFTQNFAGEFSVLLKEKFIENDLVTNAADKYMAKMIPSTFRIYLPVVDDLIREQGQNLTLSYYDSQDQGKKDFLKKGRGFQTRILSCIYAKTHLFFAEYASCSNYIIPQTLRGLSQFLDFLSTLKDIPEKNLQEVNTSDEIVGLLSEQLPIMENNLNAFEHYFVHEWAPAKLSGKMCRLIEEIAAQDPENRLSYAYAGLKVHYGKNDNEYRSFTYYELDKMMREILGTSEAEQKDNIHRAQADYYSIFAVRTILGILNMKDVVRIRQESISNFQEGSEISFSYDRKGDFGKSLPDSYFLRQDEAPRFTDSVFLADPVGIGKIFLSGFFDVMDNKFADNTLIGSKFRQQEIAVSIACSWDAQNLIRKEIMKMNEESFFTSDFKTCINQAYYRIAATIISENERMLESVTGELHEADIDDSFMRSDAVSEALADKKIQDINKALYDSIKSLPDKYPTDSDSQKKAKKGFEDIAKLLTAKAGPGDDSDGTADNLKNRCVEYKFEDEDGQSDKVRKDYVALIADLRKYAGMKDSEE